MKNTKENSKIKISGDERLEQSKKRDHKIFITEQAIEKVPLVKLPNFSNEDALTLWRKHKELLHYAKEYNHSDEVLTLLSLKQNRSARATGGEFTVSPMTNPETMDLFRHAGQNELCFLHNHPSTNKFSFADLQTFVQYANIGVMTVVTNQGELYVLQKMVEYSFKRASSIIYRYSVDIRQHGATTKSKVDEFLKSCERWGIYYEKSK